MRVGAPRPVGCLGKKLMLIGSTWSAARCHRRSDCPAQPIARSAHTTDRPGRGVISSTIVIHLFADDFLGFQPIFHMSLRLSPPLLIEFVRFLCDPFPELVRILLHGLRLRR